MEALSGPQVPVGIFRVYVTAVLDKNARNNTSTEAFTFGLYYQAWHLAWHAASSGFENGLDQRTMEAAAWYYYLLAIGKAEQLRLTSENVRRLAGGLYIPGEESLFPAIVKSGKYRHSARSVRDIWQSTNKPKPAGTSARAESTGYLVCVAPAS